jgi:hypothetical protein
METMAYRKHVIATDSVGAKISFPRQIPFRLQRRFAQLADDLSLHEMLSQNTLDFLKGNFAPTAYISKIGDTVTPLLNLFTSCDSQFILRYTDP